MLQETNLPEKENLHSRNKHRSRYDFKELCKSYPALSQFVFTNKYNSVTIDFAKPDAIKALNKALLKQFYKINYWDIPANYLCPPIPGRADYVHYLADVLAASNDGIIPIGKSVRVLDIGVGANCVYPIIGAYEYDWSFVGSDIDTPAIESANKIVKSNPSLKNIEIRKQTFSETIFRGVIKQDEFFDVTMCNPPFHASIAEAQEGTIRKIQNLNPGKKAKAILNFGGQHAELWCKGGEREFISKMIRESTLLKNNCFWFTSLVSRSENLPSIYIELQKAKIVDVKTIEMKQGNKISRFVAWTFLNHQEQNDWKVKRWEID